MELPQLDPIRSAIAKLGSRLKPVENELVPISGAIGRATTTNLLADRDSPAIDMSAMDGYALKIDGLSQQSLAVQGTSVAGSPPLSLKPGMAIRIFTGAPIPAGADCVIRREDTRESDDRIEITVPIKSLTEGKNIRRQGENIRREEVVLSAGTLLDSASVASLVSFASSQVNVRRHVRVAILNTGDELAEPGQPVAPWQIRDSNGSTLQCWLESLPWLHLVQRQRVADQLDALTSAIDQVVSSCDAVLLTGGVSMGDTDFVPKAIEQLGGAIVFHRLPLRPGKPVLGAAIHGKLVLGLPGNPISVAVCSRVFAKPLLQVLAGIAPQAVGPLVCVEISQALQLDLTCFRLINLDSAGRTNLVASRGSGDIVSISHSRGFIEVPAGATGPGPWQLTMW
jgi:molybdopterin molybdotransferase